MRFLPIYKPKNQALIFFAQHIFPFGMAHRQQFTSKNRWSVIIGNVLKTASIRRACHNRSFSVLAGEIEQKLFDSARDWAFHS
jgi:hypothetical protein